MSEDLMLKCHCQECESGNEKTIKQHYHLVKDYHPDLPWKDPKDIEKKLRRDMEKTWGKEQATIRWNKGLRE